MYSYQYPKADSTASVIAYRFIKANPKNDPEPPITGVEILGIIRGQEPFKDKLSLPGGFLEIGKETLPECAVRELEEETRVSVGKSRMELITVQSGPTRDPRGHVIDHVYAVELTEHEWNQARAGDDAKALSPQRFDNYGAFYANEWAFDHGFSIYSFFINSRFVQGTGLSKIRLLV